MTTDRWLGATEFALLAEVNRSIGSRILRAARDGKPWRGVTLTVRERPGRGPKGLRLEVAASSLPTDLLHKLDAQRDAVGADRDGHEHNETNQPAAAQEAGNSLSDAGRSAIEDEQRSANLRLKQKEANLSKYAQLPEHKRQRAEARYSVLDECESFIRHNGLTRSKGEEIFVKEYSRGRIEVSYDVRKIVQNLSVRTLRGWFTAEREHGMFGLVDDFGNRRGYSKLDDHLEVRNLVIGLIIEKPFIRPKTIFELIRAKYPEATCALTAGPRRADRPRTRRQVERAATRLIARFTEGWLMKNIQTYTAITDPDAFANKFEVALGSQSEGIKALNQQWQLDDTRADLMCTDGRYSAAFLIDIYSRRIKVLVVKSVDSVAVGTLIRSAINAWGAPEEVKVDNGRQYVSAHIKGALRGLGILLTRCMRYKHRQKGHVERVQKTMQHDGLFETLNGYIGHNVIQRKRIEATRAFGSRSGDPVEMFEATMSGADLQKHFDERIESGYHHAPHSALPVNQATGENFSPFEMAAAWRGPKRTVPPRALDVLLIMKREERTVQKAGIQFGEFYIHSSLGPYVGKKVLVCPDPDDLGDALVFLAETGEFICVAVSPKLKGISSKEIAIEGRIVHNKAMKDGKESVNDARKAARKINLADLVLRHDREAVANIAAFPHRSTAHTTLGIETATEASDALQESKKQQQRKLTQERAIKPNEPYVEVIALTRLKIIASKTMRRALQDHEVEWFDRRFPDGAPEDQVSAIVQRLVAPSESVPMPDQPKPTASSGKES